MARQHGADAMDSTTSSTTIGSRRGDALAIESRNRLAVFAALVLTLSASPAAAQTLPASHEAQCIEAAARYNAVPVALLRAIREQEGGTVGSWHVNADGSLDYGVMQINSRWLPLLSRSGYTASVLVYDACASINVGAWILAQALANRGAWNHDGAVPDAYWRAVGEYHSRTPRRNRAYAEQVWSRYLRAAPP